MRSSVSNSDKKIFLRWFTKNFVLRRREVLWILDYLYNHDIILEKTHFVENVQKAPRGIYTTVKDNKETPFIFYKNGHTFKDPMQAFHEVRLNWSSPIYIELDFENAWQYPEYLAVLEDNPYAKWNETMPSELIVEVEEALNYESLLYAKERIMKEIDESLLNGHKSEFTLLTDELFEINHKISRVILND